MIVVTVFWLFPIKDIQTPSPPLRSGGNFMQDAECAEYSGKNNKTFSDFSFRVIVKLHRKFG